MSSINVQGTIIDFPDSAQSPNWADPLVQFAQAVAQALQTVAGPFDIPPQIFTMTSNVNSNVSLPSLAFPTSNVQGASIEYSVTRVTTTTTVTETGSIDISYNSTGATNNKWLITREYVGDAQMTFSITDTGQIQFSSSLIGGSSHTGTISYLAKAILNS